MTSFKPVAPSLSGALFKIIGGMVVLGATVFCLIILSTAFGALSGWCVGQVWPNTFKLWTARLGLDVEPWQVGAMLGFVGSFFKTFAPSKSD